MGTKAGWPLCCGLPQGLSSGKSSHDTELCTRGEHSAPYIQPCLVSSVPTSASPGVPPLLGSHRPVQLHLDTLCSPRHGSLHSHTHNHTRTDTSMLRRVHANRNCSSSLQPSCRRHIACIDHIHTHSCTQTPRCQINCFTSLCTHTSSSTHPVLCSSSPTCVCKPTHGGKDLPCFLLLVPHTPSSADPPGEANLKVLYSLL